LSIHNKPEAIRVHRFKQAFTILEEGLVKHLGSFDEGFDEVAFLFFLFLLLLSEMLCCAVLLLLRFLMIRGRSVWVR